MNRTVRRKLTMATRVLEFARAHPSTDASWVSMVTRLEDRLARADALAIQERNGRADKRSAAEERRGARQQMESLLRHLIRVVGSAAAQDVGIPGTFLMPRTGAPYRTFVAAAKAMLAAATPHREALIAFGLGETLIAELEKSVAAFDAASVGFDKGRREHTGARGDLEAVADQVTDLARLLDGLVMARFRKDAELLAAWQSARNIDGPTRLTARDTPAPAETTESATPVADQPPEPPQSAAA
jgi:hypothetical protein